MAASAASSATKSPTASTIKAARATGRACFATGGGPRRRPTRGRGAGAIGHEITHGVDDQGRKGDWAGVLRDWWQPEDAAKFEAQATRLGEQYAAYEFPNLPGMRINPRVAMGENIADLGGTHLGLEAYRNFLGGKPGPAPAGLPPPR